MNKFLNKYLSITILLSLIIPAPVFGFIIDTLTKKPLMGIEKFSAPLGEVMIYVAILYLVAIILLWFSSWLLQFVINAQVDWLQLTGNPIIDAGFAFTSGLANMFLILILLAVAFALILKIESFEIKKVLPRLIIVAFLLNFSLVFMGMIIDISHIFFKTVLAAGGNDLINTVMGGLFGGIIAAFMNLVGWIIASAYIYLIPVASTARQMLKITGFVAIFGPNMVIWLLELIVALVISGVLLFFVILFAARVFVIQILAILSPLAFLCLILPQTKKFFDLWFKHFIEWVFLGLFLLFFLVLGFKGFAFLRPDPYMDILPVFAWLHIGDLIIAYTFLLIFLGVILWMSKTMIPEGASAAINMGKGLINSTVAKGMFGKTFGKIGGGVVGEIRRTAALEKQEREEREKTGGQASVGQWLSEKMLKPVHWAHKAAKTSSDFELGKDLDKKADEYKKFGNDSQAMLDAYSPLRDSKEALLLAMTRVGGKKGIDKFKNKFKEAEYLETINRIGISKPDEIKNMVKQDMSLIENSRTQDTVRRALLPEGTSDKDAQSLGSIDTSLKYAGPGGRDKLISDAIKRKVMKALTKTDVENSSDKMFEDPKFIESAALNMNSHIQTAMAEKYGQTFVDAIQSAAKINIAQVEKLNPGSLNLYQTPGGMAGGFEDIRPKPTPPPPTTPRRPANIPSTATWDATEELWDAGTKYYSKDGKTEYIK